MFKKSLFCFLTAALLLVFLIPFTPTLAADSGSVLEGTSPGCHSSGDCEVNDFVKLAIQVSEIILGLVGSLALLAFIYGGVMFLISAGNSEKVTQAKQILIGAVIGLVIVFTSYMIINFAAQALGIQTKGGIMNSTWFNK